MTTTPSFDPLQLPGANQWLNPPWAYPPASRNCIWTAIGVQGGPRESNVTVALLRCGLCGDVRTEELAGTWTLQQVRGEDAAAAGGAIMDGDD